MKPSLLTSLLTSVGGLGLTVGALLWPTVSLAQGFCYIVDAEGRVTNLDDLCESGGASQEQPPQGEATTVDTPQPAATPQRRSFTIGVPTDTGSSEAAGETSSDSLDAEFTGDEPMGNEPMGNEPMGNEPMGNETMGNEPMGNEPMDGTPAGAEPAGRQNRPGIPVEEITTPGIEVPQIPTPASPSSSPPDSSTPSSSTPAP